MSLSKQAWKKISHIYQAIIQHPFNQELMKGSLDLDKFAYYIEQDSYYLQDFARCHAWIAAKIPIEYTRTFLKYADTTFVVEQEIVHQFFKEVFHFQETGHLSPATISYTNYLLRVSAVEPVEVAVAAILPCFWIYREVGLYIAQNATISNNPYARWIETYASEDFSKMVEEVIQIFDKCAEQSSAIIHEKMLDAFCTSTMLEWHFWNDAYKKEVFYPESFMGDMDCHSVSPCQ